MTHRDDEPVGAVADEAAKLLSAVQDWLKESGGEHLSAAAAAATGVSGRLGDINVHLATGGADCTYCPLCQVIQRVRQTSPEVRTHLAVAASSLLQAAAGLLETQVPRDAPRQPGVQKIDLDDGD